MERKRLAAIASAALILLTLAAVLGVSWVSAQGLIRPDREVPAATPADLGLYYETVSTQASDGTPLVGWWMPTDATPDDNATVVFLHGYSDSRNQSLYVAPFLHDAGYNVVAFDFRAHGESGGALSTVGLHERRDAAAAAAHVQTRHDMTACAPACPLALYGWSMGGATALGAAPHIPHVHAIIVDSAFGSLRDVAGNSISHFTGLPAWPFGPVSIQFATWMAGVDLDAVRPVDRIAESPGPVLLIHGTADTIVKPADLDALEAAAIAAGISHEAWRVPGAGHVRAHETAGEAYGNTVADFLDRHLGST